VVVSRVPLAGLGGLLHQVYRMSELSHSFLRVGSSDRLKCFRVVQRFYGAGPRKILHHHFAGL